jgi:hypothetical protein
MKRCHCLITCVARPASFTKILATCVKSPLKSNLELFLSYLHTLPFTLFLPFFYRIHTFISLLTLSHSRFLSIYFHLYFIPIVIPLPISSFPLSLSYHYPLPSETCSYRRTRYKGINKQCCVLRYLDVYFGYVLF